MIQQICKEPHQMGPTNWEYAKSLNLPRHTCEIETAHAGFNRAVNRKGGLICAGNAITDCQVSNYVRPFHDQRRGYTETAPMGEIQDFDLQMFKNRLTSHAFRFIKKWTHDNGGIVYLWRSWPRAGVELIHGVTVTTRNHAFIKNIYCGPTYKSQDVTWKMSNRVSVKVEQT